MTQRTAAAPPFFFFLQQDTIRVLADSPVCYDLLLARGARTVSLLQDEH